MVCNDINLNVQPHTPIHILPYECRLLCLNFFIETQKERLVWKTKLSYVRMQHILFSRVRLQIITVKKTLILNLAILKCWIKAAKNIAILCKIFPGRTMINCTFIRVQIYPIMFTISSQLDTLISPYLFRTTDYLISNPKLSMHL